MRVARGGLAPRRAQSQKPPAPPPPTEPTIRLLLSLGLEGDALNELRYAQRQWGTSPAIEATLLPEGDADMFCVQRECNWLQALEGGIDTVHVNFLHGGRPPGKRYDESHARGRANNLSTPARIEVVPTDYGYTYAGIRDMGEEGTNHVRGRSVPHSERAQKAMLVGSLKTRDSGGRAVRNWSSTSISM